MSSATVEQLDDIHLRMEIPCEVVRAEKNFERCGADAKVRVRVYCSPCASVKDLFVCDHCLEDIRTIGCHCLTCKTRIVDWVLT